MFTIVWGDGLNTKLMRRKIKMKEEFASKSIDDKEEMPSLRLKFLEHIVKGWIETLQRIAMVSKGLQFHQKYFLNIHGPNFINRGLLSEE